MLFPERLRSIRESKNMNQSQFAAYLEYNQSKYNKWENGVNTPDFDSLCELSKKLHVSTDYLLGLSDVQTSDVEIKAICEKTGLTEASVKSLMRLAEEAHHPIVTKDFEFYNTIISDEELRVLLPTMYAAVGQYKAVENPYSLFLFDEPEQADDFGERYNELQKAVEELCGSGSRIMTPGEAIEHTINMAQDTINNYMSNYFGFDKIKKELHNYWDEQYKAHIRKHGTASIPDESKGDPNET